MDWQVVKEKAWLGYAWASQFFLFMNLMMYLAGCVVARHPVGPVAYVGFLWHCCLWRGV